MSKLEQTPEQKQRLVALDRDQQKGQNLLAETQSSNFMRNFLKNMGSSAEAQANLDYLKTSLHTEEEETPLSPEQLQAVESIVLRNPGSLKLILRAITEGQPASLTQNERAQRLQLELAQGTTLQIIGTATSDEQNRLPMVVTGSSKKTAVPQFTGIPGMKFSGNIKVRKSVTMVGELNVSGGKSLADVLPKPQESSEPCVVTIGAVIENIPEIILNLPTGKKIIIQMENGSRVDVVL